MRYARIIAEFAGHPCAMEAEKFRAVATFLRAKAMEETPPPFQARELADRETNDVAQQRGSVAVIPAVGIMTQREMPEDISDTSMKLERFIKNFRAAMSNDDVKAVVLDIDSPGGSVFGVQEASDEIYQSRGGKPIVAVANSLAASAAYWIATAADELVVTPGGTVGSIGVYTVHEDISQFLEDQGVKESIISAGRYKVEGNPFEPLDDEARAAIQARVNSYYDMFVEAVARNRGEAVKTVRTGYGEGRTLLAKAALEEGMADRIGTLEDTLARFGVEVRPQLAAADDSAPRGRGRSMARAELDLARLR